jgi:hypothetical protein
MVASALLAAWLVLWPARGHANEVDHSLRVHALGGPVLLHSSQDVGAGDAATATGFGVGGELFLGAEVSESIALGMDLWAASSVGASHSLLEETAMTAIFAGAALAFEAVPERLSLRTGLGFFRSSIEGAPVRVEIEIPQSDTSEIGVGLALSATLEWPLASGFGLGAGLSLFGASASNDDAGTDNARYVLGVLLGLHASIR